MLKKYSLDLIVRYYNLTDEEKSKYIHFVVTNEIDRESEDCLMYAVLSKTRSDNEDIRRNGIKGKVEGENAEVYISPSLISRIYTYENNEEIIENYKEDRKNFTTTYDLKIQRNIDLTWETLALNQEFRVYFIQEQEKRLAELKEKNKREFNRAVDEEIRKIRRNLERFKWLGYTN